MILFGILLLAGPGFPCTRGQSAPLTVEVIGWGTRTRTLDWENGDRHVVTMNVSVDLLLQPVSVASGEGVCRSERAHISGTIRAWGHARATTQAGQIIEELNFDRTVNYDREQWPVEIHFDQRDGPAIYVDSQLADVVSPHEVTPWAFDYSAATQSIQVWVSLPRPFFLSPENIDQERYPIGGETRVSGVDASFFGRVIDNCTGEPVRDATVSIGERTLTTTGNGEFRVDGIAPGSLTVIITKEGYEAYAVSKTMPAVCPVWEDFTLDPHPRITRIHHYPEENSRNNNTGEFGSMAQGADPFLLLRRGNRMVVDLELACALPPGYEVLFGIEDRLDPSLKTLMVEVDAAPSDDDGWEVRDVSPDRESLKRLLVFIPATAAVGEYRFSTHLRHNESGRMIHEMPIPSRVVVLFNPWPGPDEVSGLAAEELKRHVQDGHVIYFDVDMNHDFFQSPNPRNKTWKTDQFTSDCLFAVLQFLEGMSSADDRRSAATVVRHLARRVSAEGAREQGLEPGLLQGFWENSPGCTSIFGPDKSPGAWKGSRAIFKRFLETDAPVNYVQCWAFAGVLTSMYRCLGIPSRVVSGFNVSVDMNQDGWLLLCWEKVTTVFGLVTRPELRRCRATTGPCPDEMWYFHVWSEAWLTSRMGEEKAWTVIDGTPMQTPDDIPCGPKPGCTMQGLYGAGPVSHATIRDAIPGRPWSAYPPDIGYFVSSVRPGVRYSLLQDNELLTVTPLKQVAICPLLLTYNPSFKKGREDITVLYKGTAPSISPMSTVRKQDLMLDEITIQLRPFHPALQTPDFIWEVELNNHGNQDEACVILLSGAAMQYNGTELGSLEVSLDETVMVPAGQSITRSLVIPFENYCRWLRLTRIFEARLLVSILRTERHGLHHDRIVLGLPEIAFQMAAGEPAPLEETIVVNVAWTNSLPISVSEAQMTLYGSRGIHFWGEDELQLELPDLAPGELFETEIEVRATEAGAHFLAGILWAEELSGVYGDVSFEAGDALRVDIHLSLDGQPLLSSWMHGGRSYQLEFTEALGSGWIDLGPAISGADARVEMSDPGWVGRKQRYYRMRVLNELQE